MSFGSSNAPTSIQGYVNKILAEKFDVFVTVYFDDKTLYTSGRERWQLVHAPQDVNVGRGM